MSQILQRHITSGRPFYLTTDISEQSYDRWRREYGGLKLDQAWRLKDLE